MQVINISVVALLATEISIYETEDDRKEYTSMIERDFYNSWILNCMFCIDATTLADNHLDVPSAPDGDCI